MSAHRKYAGKPKDIFKTDYNEIIKSAKRKHCSHNKYTKGEFYIFLTNGWYSECAVDIYGDSIEHWKQDNDNKWFKED